MEGKIDKDGNLEIKRGKKYKVQACFYSGGEAACGGWCPQFGEPDFYKNADGVTDVHESYSALLKICQNRLLNFDKFVDERGQDGKQKQ